MASPSAKLNMPDIGRRIVEIPEFLTSVASEFDLDRQRELMLVSKYFFRSVGPIVWKSVPRLDFIMRTIKGTKVKSYRFEDSQKAHYEFTEIVSRLTAWYHQTC
jgi:hypothetical protein